MSKLVIEPLRIEPLRKEPLCKEPLRQASVGAASGETSSIKSAHQQHGSVELDVYTRYGCHLCEDMLQLLHDFNSAMAYKVRVIDIDDDPALVERYNDAVPVLTLRGEEICRHFLDLEALRKVVDPEQRVS